MSHHHLHGVISMLSERLIETASCADAAETTLTATVKTMGAARVASDASEARVLELMQDIAVRDGVIASMDAKIESLRAQSAKNKKRKR